MTRLCRREWRSRRRARSPDERRVSGGRGEPHGQRPERPGAVRAGVLLRRRHLHVRPTVGPVGDEHGVVAESTGASALLSDGALHAAVRHHLAPVGERCDGHRPEPARRAWAPSAPRRRGRRAAWRRCRRRWRALRRSANDHTPGAPCRASTSSPVSSATAGRPVASTSACAFSRALSSSVSPVSSTSGTSGGRGTSSMRPPRPPP